MPKKMIIYYNDNTSEIVNDADYLRIIPTNYYDMVELRLDEVVRIEFEEMESKDNL